MPPYPEWLDIVVGLYEPVLRCVAVIIGDELRRPRNHAIMNCLVDDGILLRTSRAILRKIET
jgi:hypothetical protein